MDSKKILIIFPDPWVKFSPSVANFIEMLNKENVSSIVLYLNDGYFDSSDLPFDCYEVSINRILYKLLSKFRILKFAKILILYLEAIRLSKKHKFKGAVGFDDVGYISARLVNKNTIYYSLEIDRNLLNRIIFTIFRPCLIIQSEERKNYLAKNLENKKVCYIQNSPILYQDYNVKPSNQRNGYLYFGHLIREHGIEPSIEAVREMGDKLVIKYVKVNGRNKYLDYLKSKYQNLIKEGILVFDDSFIKQEEIIDYISNFRIGFVFYDNDLVRRSYNYQTSPSGKAFNYLASGTPIIGSDIAGLRFIKDYEAGILVKNVNTQEILKAIHKINSNYEFFSKNAINAIKHLSYNKMFSENKYKIFKSLGLYIQT
ncbi:MAG: hypothetical protein RMJ67_07905 [Elusimicrobiota bacterium]|nr:hypothetical protein [Endomicrobiia bacterium]MDW8166417.1 hypothetical protein [Elusimicrobiota bacterium]